MNGSAQHDCCLVDGLKLFLVRSNFLPFVDQSTHFCVRFLGDIIICNAVFSLIDDILLHFADNCDKVEQLWDYAVVILSFFRQN